VYVADYWNQRIQIFDLQGHALGQFAISIWQAGSYDEPAIAVDGAGHLYVPDPAGARILVYTAAGQPYLTWGGVLNGNEQFSKPLSIAAGPGGKIFVSDAGTNQVLQFAAP
jgi:NHL repeat-containing protein